MDSTNEKSSAAVRYFELNNEPNSQLLRNGLKPACKLNVSVFKWSSVYKDSVLNGRVCIYCRSVTLPGRPVMYKRPQSRRQTLQARVCSAPLADMEFLSSF